MPKRSLFINVHGTEISVVLLNEQDYICLTDMAKSFDGGTTIKNWLRNRNTIEFLGIWEQMNNHSFNVVEFDLIRRETGLNRFSMSVKEWIKRTHAMGIRAKAGRYGGTYAHKDIAFEFGSWLSPEFKLLLIKEFQRLKEEEREGLHWDLRRMLAKVNYKLHTLAVKDVLIPEANVSKNREAILYADEAELLNLALFGMTSKLWREQNPKAASKDENIRDYASLEQLTVLSNLESLNSTLIRDGLSKSDRFIKLKEIARQQLLGLMESRRQLKALEAKVARADSKRTMK